MSTHLTCTLVSTQLPDRGCHLPASTRVTKRPVSVHIVLDARHKGKGSKRNMNQKHARLSIMIIIETGRGPVKDQFKFDNFFGILNIVNCSQHCCVASILSVDNSENNQLVMCQAQKVSTRSTFPNLSWFPREPSLSGQTSSTRLSWRPGGQLMVASLRGCTMSRHVAE